MTPALLSELATAILVVHLAVIAFNVFGLVAVPLGAWRGWAWVRGFWWRLAHLAIMAVVALQALLDRICFLTMWQSDLLREAGESAASGPLIARWIDRMIYWPLPIWVFAVLYILIWLYALALWWLVPPRRRHQPLS